MAGRGIWREEGYGGRWIWRESDMAGEGYGGKGIWREKRDMAGEVTWGSWTPGPLS